MTSRKRKNMSEYVSSDEPPIKKQRVDRSNNSNNKQTKDEKKMSIRRKKSRRVIEDSDSEDEASVITNICKKKKLNSDLHTDDEDKEGELCTLKRSNYRSLFNSFSFESKELNYDKIYGCIDSSIKQLFERYVKIYQFAINESCVRLWTDETDLYSILTETLLEDDKDKLKQYMSIIQGVTDYICNKPMTKDIVCYRGSIMTDEEFKCFKTDKIYRMPSFTSMSQKEDEAEKFRDKYMIIFHIPAGYRNAAAIDEVSVYPLEKEVLTIPYTPFKVLKKGKDFMNVQLLDDNKVSKNVPSVAM